MIPLLDRAQSRAFDQDATGRLGLPGLVLMENAGAGAALVLEGRLGAHLGRPVIVGGTGQNGGDAWVVARHWLAGGRSPAASFLVGDRSKVRGDAAVNLDALEALGAGPLVLDPEGDLRPLAEALRTATVIVDGLFGTGLDREVTGGRVEVLRLLGDAGVPSLALDLPSGVDPNTGAALGPVPGAAVTATFGGFKRGLAQHPGAALAGEVVVVGLGAPPPTVAQPLSPDRAALVTPEDAAGLLHRRSPDAHKGTAGHLLVVAGAPGRTGAAVLAGLGGIRAGAGLVTIATRGNARAAVDTKVVELMTAEIPEPPEGVEGALTTLHREAEGKGAGVIGPGLGTDDRGRALARALALELSIPAVLDADALTAFADDLATLQAATGPRVLTPHPGEAARLLGWSVADVQRDRFGTVRRLADGSGATVVLKGAGTVVAAPGEGVHVCLRGTPALGVAGTGDVLSGVLGACLLDARGDHPRSPSTPAVLGVLLHALAGEAAATGDRGLLAGEVAGAVPRVVASLLGSHDAVSAGPRGAG